MTAYALCLCGNKAHYSSCSRGPPAAAGAAAGITGAGGGGGTIAGPIGSSAGKSALIIAGVLRGLLPVIRGYTSSRK